MFTLKISTASSAFDADEGSEIARILREVAKKVDFICAGQRLEKASAPIFDHNGNTVGKWELK